jgi:hypothetical protein
MRTRESALREDGGVVVEGLVYIFKIDKKCGGGGAICDSRSHSEGQGASHTALSHGNVSLSSEAFMQSD